MNLPITTASRALVYTAEQKATAWTGILSGETKPNVSQPRASAQRVGADQSSFEIEFPETPTAGTSGL